MLVKKSSGAARGSHLAHLVPGVSGGILDRRSFLRRSGIAAGGLGAALATGGGMMTRAKAAPTARSYSAERPVKRAWSVCSD